MANEEEGESPSLACDEHIDIHLEEDGNSKGDQKKPSPPQDPNLHIGKTYETIEDLEKDVSLYQSLHSAKLYKRNTRKYRGRGRLPKLISNPSQLIEIDFRCVYGKNLKYSKRARKEFQHHIGPMQENYCPFEMQFRLTKDCTAFYLKVFREEHSHLHWFAKDNRRRKLDGLKGNFMYTVNKDAKPSVAVTSGFHFDKSSIERTLTTLTTPQSSAGTDTVSQAAVAVSSLTLNMSQQSDSVNQSSSSQIDQSMISTGRQSSGHVTASLGPGSTYDYSSLLHPEQVTKLVSMWLVEDTPSFDYGGFVVGNVPETAVLLCKSKGVLSGRPFFDAVFKKLDCSVHWFHTEGSCFTGTVVPVARVSGAARNILLGERVALNCLSRSSGIATAARHVNELKSDMFWNGEIAGSRKTTPGFRMVEKYSLLVGGCSTHRYDLSSMVMLKDNHIWSAGSIEKAVQKARKACGFSTKIEVECRNVAEAFDACRAGADVVMLDNFDSAACEEASSQIKEAYPNAIVDASGGITKSNVTSFMLPHVDVISMGSLTYGYDIVDFSLKIMKAGHDPANPVVYM